MIYCFVRRFD